jgi:hypothetical protein
MSPRHLRSVLLGLLLAAVPARAAEQPLPPVAGELGGVLTLPAIPHAPALRWTLRLEPGAISPERRGVVAIEGPGTNARAEVALASLSRGTWRLPGAELDVGQWFPVLMAQFAKAVGTMAASGKLFVSGDGVLDDGRFGGRLELELQDGAVEDPPKEWSVTGITLRGGLAELPRPASDGLFQLTFREATASGVTARDGRVEFSIDASQEVHVEHASCLALDGRVELAPFSFHLTKPEVKTQVRFNGVQLDQLATMLPTVLAEARGRISGRMGVSWTPEAGVTPGVGRLQIDPGAEASVRLSAAPGFLTSQVPPRLSLLPAWLGPIARAFSPENPAYETLRAIEMGEMQLEVNWLEVGIVPEGDAAGRTVRVVLTARPARRDVIESVRFEINVAGPLADLVRLGLEGRVQVRGR